MAGQVRQRFPNRHAPLDLPGGACRTWRFTEWWPRHAVGQFGSHREAATGELSVRANSHAIMFLDTIHGTIDRRVLLNYRVDPVALGRFLPPPFQPKLYA